MKMNVKNELTRIIKKAGTNWMESMRYYSLQM